MTNEERKKLDEIFGVFVERIREGHSRLSAESAVACHVTAMLDERDRRIAEMMARMIELETSRMARMVADVADTAHALEVAGNAEFDEGARFHSDYKVSHGAGVREAARKILDVLG